MNYDIEDIVQIASEIGVTDSIDFGAHQVDEESLYRLSALKILESFQNTENAELMLLAVATHLAVENTMLHMTNLQLLNLK